MELRADFLIVGSGIAALRAALALADAGDGVILTKAEPEESSTGYAQGGIAAAIGGDDSPARHAADTIAAGDGLCDQAAVRVLVEDGVPYVQELVAWGARFDRHPEGRLALAREGAHSVRRVLHARDATGREISRVLWARASATATLQVIPHAWAVELIVRDGVCAGVRFVDGDGRVSTATARATLVATGGAGQAFRETTNPPVATGDGIAIAYRAGARVVDLEFVQFHPTALLASGAPRFLLSEALRGEGARLVNDAGEAFMTRYDPAGDLAPRDRVARAIAREMEATGAPVYLTLAHLAPDYVRERFPTIAEACGSIGLDLACDRIPVGPAAHYLMGGVETDLSGRTSVPGLFAAGEVACTGVHGANRLASNSLLEGLVFGARAGSAMRAWAGTSRGDWPRPTSGAAPHAPSAAPSSSPVPPLDERAIRGLLWQRVGLFRDAGGLTDAVAALDRAWRAWGRSIGAEPPLAPADRRTASLLAVGRLMARAALRRQESRGAHFRSDFPARDDLHWKRHVADTIDEDPD